MSYKLVKSVIVQVGGMNECSADSRVYSGLRQKFTGGPFNHHSLKIMVKKNLTSLKEISHSLSQPPQLDTLGCSASLAK